MGYHSSTLGHDTLFKNEGPQWVPPKPYTPPTHVDVPRVVRPATQLGFELRARRKVGDYGLGEVGGLTLVHFSDCLFVW